MRALSDAVEAEAFGPVRHILHVGIGGSALGPHLLIDALGRQAGGYVVAVVSNVDGAALEEAQGRFDPSETQPGVAPKTLTPTKPFCNVKTGRGGDLEEWSGDPFGGGFGLTARPAKAWDRGV